MLKDALKYRAKAWSIFPLHHVKDGACSCGNKNCSSPGKHPRIGNWLEYQKRLPSKDEIKAWWHRWPNANIAIITGKISGMVVIDIDDMSVYKSVFKRANTGRVSTTGSGGKHLFYQYPNVDYIGNRAGFIKGVDFRGDGGYIVAPPSSHASGNNYKWTFFNTPSELPEDLLEEILAGGTDKKESAKRDKKEDWISNLLENGPEEGTRNDSIARLAGYYAAKGVSEDIVLTQLDSWATDKINGYGSDFTYKELATTIKSVFRTEHRKPKEKKIEERAEEDRDTNSLQNFSLKDYLNKFEESRVEWSIEDWLPMNTIHFVVAPPESFKSWLMYAMAISLASGLPFLGKYKVNKKAVGPVLIVQQEDYAGQTAERLAVILNSMYKIISVTTKYRIALTFPPELPIYIHTEAELRADDLDSMDRLENLIIQYGIKYVSIDPFYTFASLSNYGLDAVAYLLRLKKMRDKYNCSFSIVHHTAKKDKKVKGDITTDREEGWGSQLINGYTESGWQIRRAEGENTILVRQHFKAAKSATKPTYLQFNIDTTVFPGSFSVDEVSGKEVEESANVDIIEVIRLEGKQKQNDLIDLTGLPKATIARKLKRYILDNILTKDEEGYYNLKNKTPKF